MEKALSTATRVRREFRSGRPPKDVLPLHPRVVWQRATELLESFQEKMTDAGLKASDVDLAIVFVESKAPDSPRFILFSEGEDAALKQLSRPDVIALGLIFRQFDAKEKQQTTFPHQLSGLSERGVAVLRKAATLQEKGTKLLKNVN